MVKRYTIELRDSAINAWSKKLCVEADKNGKYVYYADHAAEVARLEKAISAAHKRLCQIDVDEESDVACYRDEAIQILKGAVK